MPGSRDFLDSLRIASPCEVPWSSMSGDDRMRHCAHCDRPVYNVARLSREEVMALFKEGERPPCLQLWRRADGTLITADCPVGRRRLRARRRGRIAAAAMAALMAACGRASRSTVLVGDVQPRPLQGKVQLIEPAPTKPPRRHRPPQRLGGEPMPRPDFSTRGEVAAPPAPLTGGAAAMPMPDAE